MADTKFLENVIKYDRYQPEFYEDTKTYVSKRSSTKKLNKGIDFYQNNKDLIKSVLLPSRLLLRFCKVFCTTGLFRNDIVISF